MPEPIPACHDVARRRPARFMGAWLAAILLLLLPAAVRADGGKASKRTLADIRNTGTALFSWLVDHIDDEGAGGEGEKEPEIVDWSACPSISYQDLQTLLVPEYIKEVPKTDGWDNELEFCLRKDDLGANHYVVGLRSPGRDGVYEGVEYKRGPFSPGDPDRDIVWIDGFFITWPGEQN